MQETLILTIGGSFISLLLIVNAYFTRETLLRVVKIEVKLEQNSTRQLYIERQSDATHKDLQAIKERTQVLELSQTAMLQVIEELKGR